MEQDSSPHLCKMGCGFFGIHYLEGMCTKCHKESLQRKQSRPVVLHPAADTLSDEPSSYEENKLNEDSRKHLRDISPSKAQEFLEKPSEIQLRKKAISTSSVSSDLPLSSLESESAPSLPVAVKKQNRCFSCRKKVGLTGCVCRCGEVFCGIHRYSDKHNCSFDYKLDGRKRLAQENPVVIGEKIQKL